MNRISDKYLSAILRKGGLLVSVGLLTASSLLISCSGTEKGEETEADIEAAMMEGRAAARPLLNRSWSDTVELRTALKSVRDNGARYDSLSRPRSREAFDSTFVHTIRTVNPRMARQLDSIQ